MAGLVCLHPKMEVFVINQYLVNQRLLDIFMVIFGLFGQNIHMLCKKKNTVERAYFNLNFNLNVLI